MSRQYFRHPRTGQIQSATSEPVVAFLRSRGYEPTTMPAEAAELKGDALDAALEEAGLAKTGTADEKRARLAEHLAKPPAKGDFDTPPDPSQTTNA